MRMRGGGKCFSAGLVVFDGRVIGVLKPSESLGST